MDATGDGSSLSHRMESILSPSCMPPCGMDIGLSCCITESREKENHLPITSFIDRWFRFWWAIRDSNP